MDPKACNYDPNANYNMLCCYPGSCNVRDIALVCPNLGEKQAEVRAYPNPVSDKLELSITNFDTDKVLVSVFDVYGKKYFENYVNTTISDVNEIDFATYSKGLYLLRVQNKKGVIITKYLIKN